MAQEKDSTPDRHSTSAVPNDQPEVLSLSTSPFVRVLLIGFGSVALALGFVGVFLPVLPTTPFILLAAACFARSSPRFYRLLMTNKYMGPYLKAWRLERRIPLNAKVLATIMIVATLVPSALFIIPVPAVKILVLVVGGSVLAYIWKFPS